MITFGFQFDHFWITFGLLDHLGIDQPVEHMINLSICNLFQFPVADPGMPALPSGVGDGGGALAPPAFRTRAAQCPERVYL